MGPFIAFNYKTVMAFFHYITPQRLREKTLLERMKDILNRLTFEPINLEPIDFIKGRFELESMALIMIFSKSLGYDSFNNSSSLHKRKSRPWHSQCWISGLNYCWFLQIYFAALSLRLEYWLRRQSYQTRKTVQCIWPNSKQGEENCKYDRQQSELRGVWKCVQHDLSCMTKYIKESSILKLEKTETLSHQKWSADKGEGNSCTQVHAIGEMTKFFTSDLSDLGHERFFPGIKFKHLEIQSYHQWNIWIINWYIKIQIILAFCLVDYCTEGTQGYFKIFKIFLLSKDNSRVEQFPERNCYQSICFLLFKVNFVKLICNCNFYYF